MSPDWKHLYLFHFMNSIGIFNSISYYSIYTWDTQPEYKGKKKSKHMQNYTVFRHILFVALTPTTKSIILFQECSVIGYVHPGSHLMNTFEMFSALQKATYPC